VLRPLLDPVSNAVSSFLNPGAAGAKSGSGLGLGDIVGGIGKALGFGGGATASAALGAGVVGESAVTGAMLAADYGVVAASTAATVASTSALTGLTSTLAAIPGWGWAAMAGVALLGLGGSKFTSSWSTGNTQLNSDASGRTLDRFSNQDGRPMTADSDAAAGKLLADYLSTAKALGIGARATEFSYAGNSGAEGKNPNFALSGGVVGLGGFTQGEMALSDEAVNLAAKRAVFATLQNSDLPTYLAGVFDNMVAGGMAADQIDAALATAAAFKQLHDQMLLLPFPTLRDLSYEAANAMVTAAGGMSTFQSALATYYDKFTSDGEKLTAVTSSVAKVFGEVGLVMPTLDANARSAFRGLVETATSTGNYDTVGKLIAVSGAFDQLATAADGVRAKIQDVVSGVSASVQSSIFNMQYGQEDNQGKYNMLDVKSNRLNETLLGSNDIGRIGTTAQDLIATINQAFGLLDADQQAAKTVEFEAKLNAIEEYVIAKGADALSVAQAANEATAQTIAKAVAEAMTTSLAASTAATLAAAAAIERAANTPATVQVSVSKSPGVEVSVDTSNRY
jgi:hypothetical protein